MNCASESQEQQALFQWADISGIPELALMFHIPNGGLRNISTAVRLKKEGVKPGIPDIFLPVARGGCHGLFIEMKSKTGRLSADQIKYMDNVSEQEYAAICAHGWEEAAEIIKDYMNQI